ncbi:MAG: transporter [Nitrospira sp.]|nr:transporter [Nitrospira sp.]
MLFALCFVCSSYAAHPLVTDDTGTQGKGKFQLEITGEYGHDDEEGVKEKTTEIGATLTYGIVDTVDIILGIPYQHIRTKDSGTTTTDDGLSDVSLELKWRFFEKEGLSFALKPGITFPTGDDEKGLGTGKVGHSLYLITTKEAKPWAFHVNLGYIRNENKLDEREDLWHASFASEVEVLKNLKVVADIGIERNPDKRSNTHPAFILGGLIYSVTEYCDLDAGIKGGLNKTEVDYALLAGITLRF